ncbi:MAG: YgiQ family radical SAM protein [Elusimicrobiota bacterium]|nr:YgiQ family radical SAM protein [Elusimicrobiales bacterium]
MSFIPITTEEIKRKGWDSVDVVLITPDAYVDHPSFAMAVIGRVIEEEGFKLAILSQPDWKDIKEFRKFGKPNLCYAISSGNMDSMINKYTHNKKIRSEDDYSPGGKTGKRPDRALIVYANMAKMAYPDVPVILGGIEATMRKFVHYDYWSDTLRKPILLDSKADLLVYGMGEKTVIQILKRLKEEKDIRKIRDIRGTVYKIGLSEIETFKNKPEYIILPSYEELIKDKMKFAQMTKIIYDNLNPYYSKKLIQLSDTRAVVSNEPQFPLTTAEMDRIYELPFTYKPHPYYKEKIPAYETVKNSIVIHRGCFGGCSFCSLAYHQGKFIQSRSKDSIIKEIKKLSEKEKIVITDIGGPSANMYMIKGKNAEICKKCVKNSCLYPRICSNLNMDFSYLINLMKEIRSINNVKKIFVASGIRMDMALKSDEYIKEIARYHTSGQLKVAPEHTQKKILDLMKKPEINIFLEFENKFKEYSKKMGKEQYLVTYFISAYPGTTLDDAIDMAVFLKKHNLKPLQINDFLPAPGEYATAVYYSEINPENMEKVYVPKKDSERKLHRALIQYFKRENIPLIIKALKLTKRTNLIPFFVKS